MIQINGNWTQGFSFDLHTMSSRYLGEDEHGRDKFENTRSEMGELVYQLKYRNKSSLAYKIVSLLSNQSIFDSVDVIVPIPPSNTNRDFQPVFSIAEAMGDKFNIPVCLNALRKSSGSQEVKSISDFSERMRVLKKTMFVSKKAGLRGRNVLLVDDLYRSGATLKAATDILQRYAGVVNVYVLTMTKTRSNR